MLLMSACLWTDSFPVPDKLSPEPEINTNVINFCTPRPKSREPLLLGGSAPARRVRCRLVADRASWTLLTPGSECIGSPNSDSIVFSIAEGVEEVVLHRSSLPWSPEPYELRLCLWAEQQEQETVATRSWRVVVVPSADELLAPPSDPLWVLPGQESYEEDES